MEKIFKKVHTFRDYILSCAFIVIGIGLFFISKIFGICLIVCGILFLIFYKSGYQAHGSSIILTYKKMEISRKSQQSVLNFLQGATNKLELVSGNEGGSLLLEVWFNVSEKIGYAQLSVYENLSFSNITEIVELKKENVLTLIEKI